MVSPSPTFTLIERATPVADQSLDFAVESPTQSHDPMLKRGLNPMARSASRIDCAAHEHRRLHAIREHPVELNPRSHAAHMISRAHMRRNLLPVR